MHYKQGMKKTSPKVDFFLKCLSYFQYLPCHGIFTLWLDIQSYKEIEAGGVKIKSSRQPASIPHSTLQLMLQLKLAYYEMWAF